MSTTARWDISDPFNAQPRVWPVCSECSLPYIYKWSTDTMTGAVTWSWSRDCKHRKAPPVMDGPAAPKGAE